MYIADLFPDRVIKIYCCGNNLCYFERAEGSPCIEMVKPVLKGGMSKFMPLSVDPRHISVVVDAS